MMQGSFQPILFITAVYSSCALAFAALVRLLFSTVFLSLLVSSLWMVSAEIHSLCWVFLPRASSHVLCQSFLQCSQCVSMSVSSSFTSSCSDWNLLERLIWKAACVSLSLSSPTLYFVHVLLAVANLLRHGTSGVRLSSASHSVKGSQQGQGGASHTHPDCPEVASSTLIPRPAASLQCTSSQAPPSSQGPSPAQVRNRSRQSRASRPSCPAARAGGTYR